MEYWVGVKFLVAYANIYASCLYVRDILFRNREFDSSEG